MPDPCPSRRHFLRDTAGFALAASALCLAKATPVQAKSDRARARGRQFLDLHRAPDLVRVMTDDGTQSLASAGNGRWTGSGTEIITTVNSNGLAVALSAPKASVKRIHLRWYGKLDSRMRFVGDAWERAYGELEWRGLVADRFMPWYFAASDGKRTDCYGVMALPAAFCFWQADTDGISLWMDVKSGGAGLQLGSRTLEVCTVICREGEDGESAFASVQAFCRRLCPQPRLVDHPIYGHNDWNFAYGRNSAASTLEVATRLLPLCPTGSNRPYIVIDDGWEPAGAGKAGPWDRGNSKFSDLPGLTSDLKKLGARPGLWIRPTTAWSDIPDGWRLSRGKGALDPTVPEARQQISNDLTRLTAWGFELIKHDFSTFDLIGRGGTGMGTDITSDGWTYAEGPIRTNAEVLIDLYRLMRKAAGSAILLGCNTFGHLSAGIFEASRIGDDTSGQNWERTRRMGVNCLGFRSAQNGAFFAIDPDIVAITNKVPWEKTAQWLDLVSRSGAVLFVALEISAVGPEQERALREAFARTAKLQSPGEPLDWLENNTPQRWKFESGERTYDWQLPTGTSPFRV